MKTICLDPVTPPLLIAGHLSFVTVDRPPPEHLPGCTTERECECGPSPWIGQRVAIYADPEIDTAHHPALGIWAASLTDAAWEQIRDAVVLDAIVGSGTLAKALPIYAYEEGREWPGPHVEVSPTGTSLFVWTSASPGAFTEITDQLKLQDWTPGRWALWFTNVRANKFIAVETKRGTEAILLPVVAPVLSGDDPTYKEWTP